MSEQFEADYKLTQNLELLTDKLQQTFRVLDGEKQKTDRLIIIIIIYLKKKKRKKLTWN